MRWSARSFVLPVLVLGGCTAPALRYPLDELWRVVLGAGTQRPPEQAPIGADLVTLLLGACTVMVAAASGWLVLAVAACTWEVLVHGTACPSAPSLLRPRLVQVCVAACLGATVLGSSAARAESPAVDDERRHRAVPVPEPATGPPVTGPATGPVVTGPFLLDGLPVPDRTTGQVVARPPEATHARGRRLEVRPGDSLWSLTTGLLPRGAPVQDVATGWRLLYAANRPVIGEDPDLLRPGQSLRVPQALGPTYSSSHSLDRRSP